MKYENINVLGKNYKIKYVDKPSEVDIFKRDSLWGQIDYWTRTIRIYEYDRTDEDVFETLLHEIFHAIETELCIEAFKGKKYGSHEELGIFALALADTLSRNDMLK